MPNCTHNIACIAGLDGTGGAGLTRDIQVVQTLGLHAYPVLSVNTLQDRQLPLMRVESELLAAQLNKLLSMPLDAIKIGLFAAEQLPFICAFVQAAKVPVVLDPIAQASSGMVFQHDMNVFEPLLPYCIITPNSAEWHSLESSINLRKLQSTKAIVITDAEDGTAIHANHEGRIHKIPYQRQTGSFRGTGCTFSAALACFLAQKLPFADACRQALQFTQHSIQNAYTVHTGEHILNHRFLA